MQTAELVKTIQDLNDENAKLKLRIYAKGFMTVEAVLEENRAVRNENAGLKSAAEHAKRLINANCIMRRSNNKTIGELTQKNNELEKEISDLKCGKKKPFQNFDQMVEPVIEYINEYHFPYGKVIIDCDSAELSNAVLRIKNEKFIKD